MLALGSSGCGLILDGAYLLSDGHTHEKVEQRKPTGESETSPERRIAYGGTRLRVECEMVTRGVDRVWTVDKDFEYQGGFYQAHWLPVLLEGAIGAGLAIGIGSQCQDPAQNLSCNLLYGTIPFGVDVAYSVARLLMIDRPKLVGKFTATPHTEPHPDPSNRAAVACDSETTVVANAPSAQAGQLRIAVDRGGWFTSQDQAALLSYTSTNHDTRISIFGGNAQRSVDLSRCEFYQAVNAASPNAIAVPLDCAPVPPGR